MRDDGSGTASEETRADQARRLATRVAGTTVGAIAGADAVLRRAGFTTRSGRISKRKLAMAAIRPRSRGGPLIRAAASEIDRRRNGGGRTGPSPTPAP